jgi:hypothetical protein
LVDQVRDFWPQGPVGRNGHRASLDNVHPAFRRWLGEDYETDALDVVLAAAAVKRLDGEPLWLLVLSGSGNVKTETMQALSGVGALTSTVTSEGALLSTPAKERAKDATCGLLRKIGSRGLLVVKDVAPIVSMSSPPPTLAPGRNSRSMLRAVHPRRRLQHHGHPRPGPRPRLRGLRRTAVVTAPTTPIRMDSTAVRLAAGRQPIGKHRPGRADASRAGRTRRSHAHRCPARTRADDHGGGRNSYSPPTTS